MLVCAGVGFGVGVGANTGVLLNDRFCTCNWAEEANQTMRKINTFYTSHTLRSVCLLGN